MTVSLIVAMSENGVIGLDGDMPWRLSADLRRFKRLTMGHAMIMGRKTYESIGRLLPGRTTIILTRSHQFSAKGALLANSLDQAIELAGQDSEVFIVGGGEVYRMALPRADRLHVTRVHTQVNGDTTFPDVTWDEWRLTESTRFPADERNDFDYSFEIYERKSRSDD